MMLIDTHTHLYEEQFDADRTAMIQRAIAQDVSMMLIPNVDASTISGMMQVVEEFPEHVRPMMGLHPCYVKPETYEAELETVRRQLFEHPGKFVAVGEIGMDMYWDKSTASIQEAAFQLQCDWAVELDLPVAIHSRDATHLLMAALKKRAKCPRGVFHCFTGSVEEAHEILKLGFYLGIGGVVTYKNTHLRDTLRQLPLERIVLETDAPYLPPVPHRGKRNESAYTRLVAETLCTVYQRSLDEIADTTTRNAKDLFRL